MTEKQLFLTFCWVVIAILIALAIYGTVRPPRSNATGESKSANSSDARKIDALSAALARPLVLDTLEANAYAVFNVFMTASLEGLSARKLDMRQQVFVCAFTAGALERMWEISGLEAQQQYSNPLRLLELLVRYLRNVVGLSEACVTSFVEDAEDFLSSEAGKSISDAGRSSLAVFANAALSDEMQKGLMNAPDDLAAMKFDGGIHSKRIQEATGTLRTVIT